MFKVNKNDANDKPLSDIFIIDFKQENVSWDTWMEFENLMSIYLIQMCSWSRWLWQFVLPNSKRRIK